VKSWNTAVTRWRQEGSEKARTSAVHLDDFPGEEPDGIGGQEDDHLGDLLGLTDPPLKPTERLGGHGTVEEGLDVKLHDVLDEVVVELLPAAVVDPAEQPFGVEPERRPGAEEAGSHIFAEPIGGDAMSPVQGSLVHRLEQLKRRDHCASGKNIDLEATTRHLLDLFPPIDKHLMKDILRGPGALHLQCSQSRGLGRRIPR